MSKRKWTIALAALFLVFLYLFGDFIHSYLQIQGIVKDIADTAASKSIQKHHIVMISQELDDPYWQTIGQAAGDEALKYNMELEYTGPYRLDPQKQTELLDRMIAAKVDGILVPGVQSEEYRELIHQAMARSIPVITVDTDSPESDRLTYVGTDNTSAGRTLGQVVENAVRVAAGNGGPKAVIGVVIGSYAAPNQLQRLDGFKSVLEQEPDFRIAEIGVSNLSQIQAAQAAEKLLQDHPDINVMVGMSALDGIGISQAVKALHKQGQIPIFGFDDLYGTEQAIKNGEIAATIVQQPERMGRVSVDLLHAYFAGESLLPEYITGYDVRDRSNIGGDAP